MMRIIRNFIASIFVLCCGITIAFAAGSYKNELVKVHFTPLGVNNVKVVLHTAKPYSEPLRLLKKNDSEYVLILPETYNSAPQKPSISDVIGEVTDADVKLYSFVTNSSQNGYTKIVIKTNGYTNLYPEAITNGGGSVATKPSNDVKKIYSEQIKPKQLKVVTPAKTETKIAENPKPVNKVEKEIKPAKKKETLIKPKEDKKVLPTALETMVDEFVEEPVIIDNIEIGAGTIIDNQPELTEEVDTFGKYLVPIKDKVANFDPHIKQDANTPTDKHNPFFVYVAILFGLFAMKYLADKVRGKKKETITFEAEEPEYSNFFKTLIEEEKVGNNPFSIASIPTAKEVLQEEEPQKPIVSHEEAIQVDQNLTWQEKFREVQKNKRVLLKEDAQPVEPAKNMAVENPIKKLKHDFKAVRKVLERQKELNNKDKTPLIADNLEKIEVISFDDYQKIMEPPKVQINKTVPIKARAPKVLTQLQLAKNKGLYLVDYKDKFALVGYINNKIFKLRTYSTLRDAKLYARMSEKLNDVETYIVKFDNNKLLVDVDSSQMKVKLQY